MDMIIQGIMSIVLIYVAWILFLKMRAGFYEWRYNNNSQITTNNAIVKSKRIEAKVVDINGSHIKNDRDFDDVREYTTTVSNKYYVTFENNDLGIRQVFSVNQKLYDSLNENDKGMLTFQGTRFHNFKITAKNLTSFLSFFGSELSGVPFFKPRMGFFAIREYDS